MFTKHPALCKASPETTWKLFCVCSLPSLLGNWSHHEQEVNGLGGSIPRPHFKISHFSLICLPNTVWLERLELSPPLLSRLHYSKVLPVPEAEWQMHEFPFIKHLWHTKFTKYLLSIYIPVSPERCWNQSRNTWHVGLHCTIIPLRLSLMECIIAWRQEWLSPGAWLGCPWG